MKKYYIHVGEIQEGPFDIQELQLKNIAPETYIWFNGLGDWTTANQIEELKTLFTITPPPFKNADKDSADSANSLHTNVMNKQRLALLIVSAVGMLATFLPWVKAPILGELDGTRGDGWITFVLYLIPLIICLNGNKKNPVKIPQLYGIIYPGIIAIIIGVWKINDLRSTMSQSNDDNSFSKILNSSVSIGFGLYLVILAGISLIIVTFIFNDKPILNSNSIESIIDANNSKKKNHKLSFPLFVSK